MKTAIVISIMLLLEGCYKSNNSSPQDTASDTSTSTIVDSADSDNESDADTTSDTQSDFSNCFIGDYSIQTVEDIAAIEAFSCITGALVIENTDLASVTLANLERIGTNLVISNNRNLTGFSFLRLTDVGQDLVLGCPTGENLSAQTCFNPELKNLSGLKNVSSIGGSIKIVGNFTLSTIRSLNKVSIIKGDLLIIQNDDLTDIGGIKNVTKINGDFQLKYNSTLSDIDVFSAITSVGGSVIVSENRNLESIHGLESLVTIGGDFILEGNSQVAMLAIPSLTSIGGRFVLENNYYLETIEPFALLTAIGNDLTVSICPALTTFQWLPVLFEIRGDFSVDFSGFTSFKGLENVTSIGGFLRIHENFDLLDFLGLESLATVSGGVAVYGNPNLTTLTHLESLLELGTNEDGEDFYISDNTRLPYCEICSFYSQLSSPPINEKTAIHSNSNDACGDEPQTIEELSCD